MINFICSIRLVSFVLILLVGCGQSSASDTTELLDSGLKTMIWEVDDKKDDAELRLVIKTGSLAEEEGERGFAHFVEHLSFNNTVKYPKETLFRKLEAFGMSFGAHSNAQTGFDSTIYKLSVKGVTDEKLDRAMDILSQWAMHVEFDQSIVDAEKGVIREEWRLRKPQEEGWQARYLKTLHQNSHYADRLPIGNINDIESATAEKLGAFYKRWYRPDNAAVIVTGAVKTDQVKQLIGKYFSEWEAKEQTPDNKYNISTENMPELQFFADKNVDGGTVQLTFYVPESRPQNHESVLKRLEWISALSILEQRLQSRIPETAGKVNGIYVGRNYPSPDVLSVTVSASVAGNGLEVATKLLNEEVAFLLNKGVTDEELTAWQNRSLERNRTYKDTPRAVASMSVRNVLYGQPSWTQPEWLTAIKQLYPEMKTGDVNITLKRLLSGSPQILMVHNPSIPVPTETQLSQWLVSSADAGKARKQLSSAANGGGEWLINPEVPGEITTSRKISEHLHEWTLSNGIVVYYQYSDKRPGKVWYQLSGEGGMNVLSQNESIQARLAMETIGSSGLRAMNGPDLAQWLSNQNLSLYPYYGFFDRGLYGSGGSKSFEKLMRLLHVSLTEGRVAPPAWKHNLENNRQQLLQLEKSRTKPWRKLTDRILFGNDAAFRILTLDELNAVQPEALQRLYSRKFSGAQNYRLAIVGDLSESDARSAVINSIASLPVIKPSKQAQPRVFPKITNVDDVIVEGSGERSAVVIHKLVLPKAGLTELRFDQLSYLRPWINAVMLEELREKDGLVYSVSTTFESGLTGVEDYTLTIQLACDPEKITQVRERIEKILLRLAAEPPEQGRLISWQNSRISAHEDSLQKPGEMAAAILSAPLTGMPLEKLSDVKYRTALPKPEELSAVVSKMTGGDAIPVWMIWLP